MEGRTTIISFYFLLNIALHLIRYTYTFVAPPNLSPCIVRIGEPTVRVGVLLSSADLTELVNVNAYT